MWSVCVHLWLGAIFGPLIVASVPRVATTTRHADPARGASPGPCPGHVGSKVEPVHQDTLNHEIPHDDQHGVWTCTPVTPKVWRWNGQRNAFSGRSTDDRAAEAERTVYLFLVLSRSQRPNETLRTRPRRRGLRTALAPLSSSSALGVRQGFTFSQPQPRGEVRTVAIRADPCPHSLPYYGV